MKVIITEAAETAFNPQVYLPQSFFQYTILLFHL